MRTPPLVKVQRVLVPLDGSRAALDAVRLGAQMARAFHAEVVLLYVLPLQQFPTLMAEAGSGNEEKGQLFLGEAAKVARLAGVEAKVELRKGHVVDQILRAVSSHTPDLIVMGTRGMSRAKGAVMGSVSQAISRRAPCTVVLVR